jgi:DNA-binding response OmpR family regulator
MDTDIDDKTVAARLKLPMSLAKVLVLLLDKNVVTPQVIEEELPLVEQAKVTILRLRRRLEKHGIQIQSQRGVGYWLGEDAKHNIRSIIGETT